MSLTQLFETAVLGETGHGSLYRVVTDPPSGMKIQFPSILGPLTSETASVRFRQNRCLPSVDMSTDFLHPRATDLRIEY